MYYTKANDTMCDIGMDMSVPMPIEPALSPLNCVTVTAEIDTHTNSANEEIFGDSYLGYIEPIHRNNGNGIDLTQTQEIIRSVWTIGHGHARDTLQRCAQRIQQIQCAPLRQRRERHCRPSIVVEHRLD